MVDGDIMRCEIVSDLGKELMEMEERLGFAFEIALERNGICE